MASSSSNRAAGDVASHTTSSNAVDEVTEQLSNASIEDDDSSTITTGETINKSTISGTPPLSNPTLISDQYGRLLARLQKAQNTIETYHNDKTALEKRLKLVEAEARTLQAQRDGYCDTVNSLHGALEYAISQVDEAMRDGVKQTTEKLMEGAKTAAPGPKGALIDVVASLLKQLDGATRRAKRLSEIGYEKGEHTEELYETMGLEDEQDNGDHL